MWSSENFLSGKNKRPWSYKKYKTFVQTVPPFGLILFIITAFVLIFPFKECYKYMICKLLYHILHTNHLIWPYGWHNDFLLLYYRQYQWKLLKSKLHPAIMKHLFLIAGLVFITYGKSLSQKLLIKLRKIRRGSISGSSTVKERLFTEAVPDSPSRNGKWPSRPSNISFVLHKQTQITCKLRQHIWSPRRSFC